jgi:hypothetical protein
VTAITSAFKVDIGTKNGVCFKDDFTNALAVVQSARTSGCGPLSWTSASGYPDRPNQLRWYVAGEKACSIKASVTFAIEYQPGIAFGSNNAINTPELTSLSWKGYDLFKIAKLTSALVHFCFGSPITTCTVSLPIKTSFRFAVNVRYFFVVDGYAFMIEIGTDLRRLLLRLLRDGIYAECSESTSTSSCSYCATGTWDVCDDI